MASITVDVVASLPHRIRELSCETGSLLTRRIQQSGHHSRFSLGRPLPGLPGTGVCEPHISLFMLAADQVDVDVILRRLAECAQFRAPFLAYGGAYRPNPVGAPELHFRKSTDWSGLQRAVVTAIEPVRGDRLRELDPTGRRIADLIAELRDADPDSAQLRQLLRYGYDEIHDEAGDRFNPHITLAWPAEPITVPLSDLPPVSAFDLEVSEVAAWVMGPWGTCVERLGAFPLTGAVAPVPV